MNSLEMYVAVRFIVFYLGFNSICKLFLLFLLVYLM